MISASMTAVAGVNSDGLSTTALPQAKAGAVFQAGMAMGKFHGVIRATTPSGSREISTSTPARIDGNISPPSRNTSPA